MIIKEIESISLVNKSNLPETDYVANPYTGCSHGCIYCYARFMKRFTGHQEPWGEFVDVKINAKELAKKELSKLGQKTVLLSSVTDPYQPLERKYELTRKILEQAVVNNTPISILTKSNLVLRDLDLLKQLDNCSVGISFSSSNDSIREIFEPRTSSVEQKFKALDEIKKSGVKTYAFLGPILPELTNIETLFERFSQIRTDLVMVENLNMKGTIFSSVINVIRENYPNLVDLYYHIQQKPDSYWNPIKSEIVTLSHKYQLPIKIYFDH